MAPKTLTPLQWFAGIVGVFTIFGVLGFLMNGDKPNAFEVIAVLVMLAFITLIMSGGKFPNW